MQFPLKQVAAVLGLPADRDAMVTGWSTDTRTLAPGDLFFALSGPNFDGSAFAAEAVARGAVAVVTDDALAALQKLAAWARDCWGGDIVAITGSAGKTSTKEVIADLLATRLSVGRTTGNFNNHIGVPLSLLRLPAEARVGVIEIGMNHAGEIRDLAKMARPRIAVVTNAGYAHVENFEDGIEGVARAKRELVEALPADGIAVLNADDARVAQFTHAGETITFGIDNAAGIRAEDVACTDQARDSALAMRALKRTSADGMRCATFWRVSRWRACTESRPRTLSTPWAGCNPAACVANGSHIAVS
jgi:UDP-N-acetylmuramoyl-tripeptide--D-alanyl-D-alanine ligase